MPAPALFARRTLPVLLLALAGCGGEPPETLGGFSLGLTQAEVMAAARDRGGFGCRVRASRPPLTICSGPSEEGEVTAVVQADSVIAIALRLDAAGPEPRRVVERFVRPFGDPAWRDRPLPPQAPVPESYHTLWLDADSVRALAMSCDGPDLAPPCTAELRETTPAGVQATLDELLRIRR